MNPETVKVRLEPLAVEVDIPLDTSLISSLSDHGIEFPCGGTGLCGGCGVRVLAGSLKITDADRAVFTPEELDKGWRLACQARARRRWCSSAASGTWTFSPTQQLIRPQA